MKKITKSQRQALKKIPKRTEYPFSVLRLLFFLWPFFLLLSIVILINYSFPGSKNSFYNLLAICVLLNAPLFFLIINHFFNSPIVKINFDTSNFALKITYRKQVKEILYNEIRMLEIVENRAFRASWGFVEYAIIHLNNKERIQISCLLINPIKLLSFNLSNKVELRKSFFPLIQISK